jgi:hypothetical protein
LQHILKINLKNVRLFFKRHLYSFDLIYFSLWDTSIYAIQNFLFSFAVSYSYFSIYVIYFYSIQVVILNHFEFFNSEICLYVIFRIIKSSFFIVNNRILYYKLHITVKPLYCEHHRDFSNASTIRRCSL